MATRPSQYIRLITDRGHPICLWCGKMTNNAYRDHPDFLICWNCSKPLHLHDDAGKYLTPVEGIRFIPLDHLITPGDE